MTQQSKPIFITETITVEHIDTFIGDSSKALTLATDHIQEELKAIPIPQPTAPKPDAGSQEDTKG